MRLPALTSLSPRQQEISDRISSRRGGTRGPFLVWLRSPELCEKVEALGAYCRFESALDPRLRELSLLIAARHFDAQYSWNAHVGKAAGLGVSRDGLAALAERREPDFGQEDERVVYRLATEILGTHFVSDGTFSQAVAVLGEQGMVDLIGCLGNFSCWPCCSIRSRSTCSRPSRRSRMCAASRGSSRSSGSRLSRRRASGEPSRHNGVPATARGRPGRAAPRAGFGGPVAAGLRRVADWIIADSGGQARVLINMSTDSPSTVSYVTAARTEFTAFCPDCTVVINKISSAHFGQIAASTRAALRRKPGTGYVISEFEQYLQPTIGGSSSPGRRPGSRWSARPRNWTGCSC